MESKKKSIIASTEGSNLGTDVYKSLIDNSISAIFLSRPTGEIIEVNNAAEKMFGYSKADFVKIGREGILDQKDIHLPILLAQRREAGKANGEITGIKKNGERFPIAFTSSIFKDHSGEELTCTIMQDITDRKIVEQEMELMLNNTEECFMLLDKDLLILNFNKQFKYLYKKYFHSSVEKGLEIFNFVKPERLTDAEEIYKSVLSGEVIFKTLEAKDEEGSSHYFKVKFAPSKNEGQEIIGFFITIREITEETKSTIEIEKRQKKIEQAEVNYRELFEKGIDGIFIHEQQSGRVVDANQKACKIFGLDREELLKLDLSVFAESSSDFTPENLPDKLIKASNGIPQLFEGLTRHSNGTLNFVEVSLQRATIAGKERILAYFRLINDRKNAERQSQLLKQDNEVLINTTDELIWSFDCELKLIAANNAYFAMTATITTIPHKIGDVVLIDEYGEALNATWKVYYQRALGGEKYTLEEQFCHPITQRLTYELVSFNPIFSSNKKITGVACYSRDITELTETQLAVKATKAELDNVMASSMDMICTVAEDNRIVRVSAASETILGYKPEELIGKFIFDFVYHEDMEETQNHVQQVITSKSKVNYYNRYVRKDGTLVYLEWTAQWDAHSKNRYGVARDVTAKVETENKLKLSEQRFKSLVQDGGDMIAIIDAQANYIYISPTSFNILGYFPEEFQEKNAFDFIHPEDVETVQSQFGLLEHTKKITLQPFRFKHKNGEWRWIETSVTNLMDEPSIQGMVANSRDVTERKNIEEALLTTKEDYKNLFENSPAPMFIFDFETLQIIDCNEETLLKYGYSKEEFLQLTIKDIRPKEDIAKIKKAVESEEAYGEIHKEIWRHKKKNGELMYMDITGHLINYNGRRVSLVMLIDITEKLKIEQQNEFEKRDKEALINNTEDLIWSVSQGFKLIAVNKAYIKNMALLTGVTVEPGDNVMLEPFFRKSFIKTWKDYYLRALKGEVFKEEIYNEALKERSARWLEVNFNPIRNGNEITGLACHARDITERKNEDLLKELLRKIRIIFNEPIGINATLDKVLKDVTLFGDFAFAESWLLNADKKEIKRATKYVTDSTMGIILTETSLLNTHKKGEGLVGTAWQTLALQIWEDKKELNNIMEQDVLLTAGITKIYALPFLNNAEIIGVLVFGLDKPETSTFKFENLFSSLKIYLGAEIKRKQLEQELNQIFNFAPDIIAIVGTDGYFKKINPAACDLLEYSLDELMAVPFLTFVHPEDENKTIEEFKNLLTDKAAFYFENRYLTKSGKIKWFAWTSTISKEEEVLFTVGKDITEKKDLEMVLHKANNLARIGSWEFDLEKNTLYWSGMTREIHETPFDYEPTFEKAINTCKNRETREIMRVRVASAIESGIGFDEELLILTETGNERWIRCIGKPEFSSGKCSKVYGSHQDINERKRAEENIRSSEERRELIMKAALDAIICIDKNGAITFWNPQAEFIFGWTEAEIMGKILSQTIIPIQYREHHDKGMQNYFKTGKGNALNKLLQLSAIKKSGEEFPIELTVLPIDQDGDEFFCAFIRDITERKLSETRLLNLNHSLQTQTSQLATINKELEQFAYVASHDLQEPLRMITSFLSQIELKYENVLDEKGKKYIYFAVDGAKRMRQIILDLLEYSTIGRIDDLKENIDLNTIVDEIKILYTSKIEEQQAIIITDQLPVISSYKSPVRQVFQNIIGNSLKYCKKGRPCLIKIFAVDMVTHWQFAVQDNGIGINKEYFDKIFVIFQRLHTKETYSGTGLGLAVTKKIIENLNGKIWLESVENEGTIFHFTIPKI